MELRDYLRTLRKGWPVVLALAVLGAALGIGLTLATTKVYRATVQVFVASSVGASSDPANAGASAQQANLFTTQRVQSYTDIADSPSVTSAVLKDHPKLKRKLSSRELQGKISASAPADKVLINLSVNDTSPRQAAQLANYVATSFNTVVAAIEQTNNSSVTVKLTVIHPATVPNAPIKPSKVVNIGLGLIVGLLLGVGVVFVRDLLDNTIKGPQDVEAMGLVALGLVPFDKRTQKSPIAFRIDPHGPRSEAYRQLRTNLQFVNIDNSPRVIAVTSAVPGEGKTTTAINLAAALAEGGYRVCLVEADFRRPNIASALGLVSDVGFTTVLIGKASIEDVLQNAGRNLAVLTCGAVPPNPSELLITDQANAVIRKIAESADYTIVDTAPLLPVADGAEVAAMADATLLVHHAGKSTREQMTRSIEALAKVGERPVGVVLNKLVRGSSSSDYGYYYTYRPERGRRPGGKDGDFEAVNGTEPESIVLASEPAPVPAIATARANGAPQPTNGSYDRPISAQSFAPESPTGSLRADEPDDWFSSAAEDESDDHSAALPVAGHDTVDLDSASNGTASNGTGRNDADYAPVGESEQFDGSDQLDADDNSPSHRSEDFDTTEIDTSALRTPTYELPVEELDGGSYTESGDYEVSRAERWRELRARRLRR